LNTFILSDVIIDIWPRSSNISLGNSFLSSSSELSVSQTGHVCNLRSDSVSSKVVHVRFLLLFFILELYNVHLSYITPSTVDCVCVLVCWQLHSKIVSSWVVYLQLTILLGFIILRQLIDINMHYVTFASYFLILNVLHTLNI
jgi:hypothetical protein